MTEIWKDIIGYEGLYQVSNLGRVKGKRMKGLYTDKDGYYHVNLYKNGKMTNTFVHRLVALNFIDNPENKAQVNHIDENKSNNAVSNLNWMTNKENINWGTGIKRAHKTLRKQPKNGKSITNGIDVFISVHEAARSTSSDRGNIYKCLKDSSKTCGGFHWSYV
ncbi:HNH homing endonuclease [Lactococcus phage PMBT68]|nr:HNH homing endonuclease [Lactococcus phage P1411]